MISLPKNKQLILFDGVCNLCNNSVKFIIKHDKHNKFMFAPLQSQIGTSIIKSFKIDTAKTDSIVLYSKEKGLKVKSTAALHIAKSLGFPLSILSVFLLLPTSFRNKIYDFIAQNRYRWFGKKETCMIPTNELKSRFIS